MDNKQKNPIVEIYRGKAIRKYPMANFRTSIYEMKRIIDAEMDLGISLIELLSCISQPLNANDNFVTVYNSDGKKIRIPKGILKKRL